MRTFNHEVDDRELIWHRDLQDREITVISSDGWSYQLDDSLPILMKPGDKFMIPKMIWHRILKGRGDLVIRIFSRCKDN